MIDVFIPIDTFPGSEYAEWDQVAWAARRVITTCVVSPMNDGGYITHIGTYSTISINFHEQSSLLVILSGTDFRLVGLK